MDKIEVYGADWCGMTKRSRALLDGAGVAYEYTDIDGDREAAAWVREQNPDGKERKPTIKIGTRVLVEPSDAELSEALRAAGSMS